LYSGNFGGVFTGRLFLALAFVEGDIQRISCRQSVPLYDYLAKYFALVFSSEDIPSQSNPVQTVLINTEICSYVRILFLVFKGLLSNSNTRNALYLQFERYIFNKAVFRKKLSDGDSSERLGIQFLVEAVESVSLAEHIWLAQQTQRAHRSLGGGGTSGEGHCGWGRWGVSQTTPPPPL